MEKIKAYHSIRPFVSKDQLNEVANMLNLTEVDECLLRIDSEQSMQPSVRQSNPRIV